MDLDLGCVEAFLALVDERHYARAAARLHLSPSALTRRVQQLERQLGTALVERGSAGVYGLTPAGERLARTGAALLVHARAVQRDIAPGAGGIRVGVPGAVGDYPTGRQLAEMRALVQTRHPSVRLGYVGVPLPALDRSLAEEIVDVLWTVEHPARNQQQTPLASAERVGLVGATHHLAEAVTVDGAAFAELPMVSDRAVDAGWMAPWLLADLRPSREARLIDIRARGVSDVARAVARGGAVTVVHAPLARRLPPVLRVVALANVPQVRYVAARRAHDHRGAVRDVIAVMREVAQGDVP